MERTNCLRAYVDAAPEEERALPDRIQRGPSAGDTITMFRCAVGGCVYTCSLNELNGDVEKAGNNADCVELTNPAVQERPNPA